MEGKVYEYAYSIVIDGKSLELFLVYGLILLLKHRSEVSADSNNKKVISGFWK